MNSERSHFFNFRPGAALRATGDDAFSFLQGQFTNDLRQPDGSATYGLWLNQKGKVLADSHVLRVSEKEFLIVSAVSETAVIRRRLEDYIVADDVILTDESADLGGLLVAGPGVAEVLVRLLGGVFAAGRFRRVEGMTVFHGRRVAEENFEVLGAAAVLDELRRRLLGEGFVLAEPAQVEFSRIGAGVPIVPIDVGPGDLPNEGGLEETAISFTKGCYLGQEVMARLKNLGQVRRGLHVVRGRGAPPVTLAGLYQGEKKVGELRSVAGWGGEFAALAMLSLVNLQRDVGLSLEPGGPATLTVQHHG